MILLIIVIVILSFLGCKTDHSEQTVDQVNLEKFMGDWYVLAILPNAVEKKAVNSIESYQLNNKGNIYITLQISGDLG